MLAICVAMTAENPQDVSDGVTTITEHTSPDMNVDDASYMLAMVSKHLQHKRSNLCAQDPMEEMVHQFFDENHVICPCCHPSFDKTLQIVAYIHDTASQCSMPAPRKAMADGKTVPIHVGLIGSLIWDWRCCDVIDIDMEIMPKKTLNVSHYELTGYETNPEEHGKLCDLHEMRLVKKVGQDWYPDTEDESEHTCAICLGGVPQTHFLTPCGHHFHHACMVKWAEGKSETRCPMCMTVIPPHMTSLTLNPTTIHQ